MSISSIVVGVDDTEASTRAAATAWDLAQRTGARCTFVHVSSDVTAMPSTLPTDVNIEELMEAVRTAARETVRASLEPVLPSTAMTHLEVRTGRAAWVLPYVLRDFEADLLVLGGKQHAALSRWFGGSTAHHVLRAVDIPLLIRVPEGEGIERILVAVDDSHALRPVVETASHLATVWESSLRILHAVEPLPLVLTTGTWNNMYRTAREASFKEQLDDLTLDATCESVVRHGRPSEIITTEAADWGADLIVLGSHGKGWVDRMLVGSTTHKLLNHLPTSLFVVPISPPPQPEGG